MVKKVVALVALLTAVAAIGVIPNAVSQGNNTETIRVKTVDAKDRTVTVDTNDNGDEDAGDFDIGNGPMFRGGDRVGGVRHTCALLPGNQKTFRLDCVATFSFRGRGSIMVAGSLAFRRRDAKDTFAITGGTGEFKNASGTVVIEGTRNGLNFEFRVIKG